MMTINRSNVVLVIVVVAALAVASVVAAHGHGAATALSTAGADNPSAVGLADTSALASSTGSAATSADPAKQQPTLDQFTSRDPFIQATGAPAAAGSGNPSPTPTAEATPVAADIKVEQGDVTATYHDQKVGDQLPPAGAVVQIKAITANAVTLKLLNSYTIGGDANASTFDVAVGSPTTVTLEKNSAKTTYLFTVVDVIYSNGSSSNGSSSSSSSSSDSNGSSMSSDTGSTTLAGHSIKALSIETADGVPAATLSVDGHTYAARTVGSVISTSWGQIKIVGINGPAQTVTILHGDEQVTIRVGQSVSK
jgi:hypothetical protein